MTEDVKVVATNRKAGFEYFLLERFEAGLSLRGSEIKSIRAGQISITEAYVMVEANEAWLIEAHIAPYEQANRMNHDPKRPRRLLLHKKEIHEMWNAVRQKGVTIVPIRVYLKEANNCTISATQLPNATRNANCAATKNKRNQPARV
jgi:SsrA-binding protein